MMYELFVMSRRRIVGSVVSEAEDGIVVECLMHHTLTIAGRTKIASQ